MNKKEKELNLLLVKMNEAIKILNQAVKTEDLNAKESLHSFVDAITNEIGYLLNEQQNSIGRD